MKIIINTSGMRFGGAVQVALSFINECKYFTEHEYHVFVGRGVRNSLIRENFPSNFYFYDFDIGPISLRNISGISKMLSEYEVRIRPDCVVSTSGPSYWHTKVPHLMGYNLPLYIYPESPYLGHMSGYRKIRWYLKRRFHFYFFKRDATAFIVQTDDVNQRLSKALNYSNVYTISNTHNGFYTDPKEFSAKLTPKLNQEVRLFTPTSYYPHKNIEIIPALLDELQRRGLNKIKFILTIDSINYDKIFGKKFTKEVVSVGAIKPEECPSLYQECDIMFLPTLAECFSASYPEAMVMQKPIVTTDLGFAHDICDNAALYYEPMNPIAAADAIEQLLNDKELQRTLIKNGLQRLRHFDNSKERARKILEICKGLVANITVQIK